jgi:isopentenyl-diphosphate Delta-isomerase
MTSEDVLILVNGQDEILGYDTKAACHHGQGRLHRAFSILLFNQRRELFLQQRSAEKLLWPFYWSNSVCSHPRQGENYDDAASRRLVEELGVSVPLRWLFSFQYHAEFGQIGSEYERCAVFVGQMNGQPIQANPAEIAAWKFIGIDDVEHELTRNQECYTPWFQLEWIRILRDFRDQLP